MVERSSRKQPIRGTAEPTPSNVNRKTARGNGGSGHSTVTFRFHAPHATKVDVAGTFSNWTLKQMRKRKDGTWTTSLRPKPGTHEYKFVVDHEWIEDPDNPEKVNNGYGGCNSVCRVE